MPHDNIAPLKRISLLASSFSGSTLFGILLSQDQRFIGFGDTYLIPGLTDGTHSCSCGTDVIDCEFRAQLAEQLESRNLPADMILDMKYRIPGKWVSSRFGGTRISTAYKNIGKIGGYERIYADFLERERGFLESIGSLGAYQYYLDGCKNLVRADIFAATAGGNQIVHLLRDPYAVLHSGATRHIDRRRTTRKHLQGWIKYNLMVRKLCEQYPDTSVMVLFDDLVSNPGAVLDRLATKFAWGALDVQPDNLNPEVTHIIGNRSRHTSSKVRAKQLQPDAKELRTLGIPQKELDKVSAAYELLRNAAS